MPGKDCCSEVSIVGGTYRETCYWPDWNSVFGSGWRAVRVFRVLSPDTHITYYSAGNDDIRKMTSVYAGSESLTPLITPTKSSVSFYYRHPLAQPVIQREEEGTKSMDVSGKFVIGFGMLEATARIEGEYVVYDPQSPSHPLSFRRQGGKAQHLALVLNETEARLLTGEQDLARIRTALFENEGCDCLVVKCGAKGAVVYTSADDEGVNIPVYKTSHVWPIGSGDVFTTVFAHAWFNGTAPCECAEMASKAVAAFCDTGSYENIAISQQQGTDYTPLIPRKKGMVYLAGPFFNLSQKLFVDECKTLLEAMGVEVFSPYHDVGEGAASEVAPKDLEALKNCNCLFAIADGLDSGTLFEIGYAVARGMRVVAYVENESEGALKMLTGTGCDVEHDFTTAIYKTCWYATE